MLKGVNWTKHFFTQLLIRSQYPTFARKELSSVFSQLQWERSKGQFAQPFNETFRKRYNHFEEKLTADDYNCYKEDKQDIPPLLTAALSISISVSHNEKLPGYVLKQTCTYIVYVMDNPSGNKPVFMSFAQNRNIQIFTKSIFHKFTSGARIHTTDETIARLCFHWLGTLQITKSSLLFLLLVYLLIFMKNVKHYTRI
ncbi:hypothetical protein RFI_30272, partial [Reticulomyxa filosa]